jgi:L-iditol 2-dehydrogenase
MVEALSIAVHAAGRATLSSRDTAVVVGAGMIGLLVVQVLRAAGCAAIVALDLDPARLELARKLGADAALKADDAGAVEEVKRRTDGRGVDAAFEVVGVGPAVQAAVGLLRKGGRLVLVGNLAAKVDLPLQAVVTRELTLLGSCASAGEYPACLDLMAGGRVDVAPLISAVAPLEEGAAWFERLHRREPGLLKVILRP